ncbi:hypothetical protein NEOC65_001358 [Neochlamydia sp. AcF65]|nr:hypothetical protein [Neochlamydia sp. AcF65]MBS4170121.1 hypothetical protein [Neochlamydia sp. AcF95]
MQKIRKPHEQQDWLRNLKSLVSCMQEKCIETILHEWIILKKKLLGLTQ